MYILLSLRNVNNCFTQKAPGEIQGTASMLFKEGGSPLDKREETTTNTSEEYFGLFGLLCSQNFLLEAGTSKNAWFKPKQQSSSSQATRHACRCREPTSKVEPHGKTCETTMKCGENARRVGKPVESTPIFDQ